MKYNRNNLDLETSPYLLQHKNNPIWWQSWNQEILNYAKETETPLLISIGYSACHWCHVMEHECFEDREVAAVMNKNFICIKIDREERPDVDAVYMNALHIMKKQGGWPLNVFTLPTGEPIFGGTYFPKENWLSLMDNVQKLLNEQPKKVGQYARAITNALRELDQNKTNLVDFQWQKNIDKVLVYWKQQFDTNWGGTLNPPKFMTPCAWNFLLEYTSTKKDKDIDQQLELTLNRMSWGGIYDHIAGGFSRYSVDEYWKIPHYEKMLYDNAQLLSLYSKAYRKFKNPNYKNVVRETINWLKNEMWNDDVGAFYSALDADSEGEEGKFYVWKKQELQEILGTEYELFNHFYNIESFGYWEEGNSVLMQLNSDESFAQEHQLKLHDFLAKKEDWKQRLRLRRKERIRPSLDDKILTSWNAMSIVGLLDSYQAFENPEDLKLANKTLNFIWDKQFKEKKLYRNHKNEKSTISGFLEDYAWLAKSLIKMYQTVFDESYLDKAREIIEIVESNFYDSNNGLYSFDSLKDDTLIAKNYEIYDTVIPSSNAIMAENLFLFGKLTSNLDLIKKAKELVGLQFKKMQDFPINFGQWYSTLLKIEQGFYEVAISGKDFKAKIKKMRENNLLPCVFTGSESDSSQLLLLQNRYKESKTLIYICQNQTCSLPLEDAEAAIQSIKKTI